MIRSLYTSAWSMIADSKRIDVISNNLANVDTNAYKKDMAINKSFDKLLTERINDIPSRTNPTGVIGDMSYGRDVSDIYTYYTQGEMVQTDEKLDVSIQNSDTSFFTVETKDANGATKNSYTRDGTFVIDVNSRLTTKNGEQVIGQNGSIKLNSDEVVIQKDGSIYENGVFVDKLAIVNFANKEDLRKQGNNLVVPIEGSATNAFNGEIAQGFVEKSNVNVVSEMVEMISVLRSFEVSQKMIQAADSILQKAVNEVGVVK